MRLDHWLMLLLTPRWLTLCVRGSSSPKPQAVLALLPHLLLASSAGCRSHSCSQETATPKPNLLIPARAGCDDFRSNGKLHHMATLPSAQLSGEGPHLAALRRLSCPCFAQLGIWRLAYYTSDAHHAPKELSTADSLFREISLQINFFQSMKLISPLEHMILLQLQVQKPLQPRLLLTQFLRFWCPSHTSVIPLY